MFTVLNKYSIYFTGIFAEKNVSSFPHFFSKYISIYATFNDQISKNMLTNDIVSFEQLGLENLPSVSIHLN